MVQSRNAGDWFHPFGSVKLEDAHDENVEAGDPHSCCLRQELDYLSKL